MAKSYKRIKRDAEIQSRYDYGETITSLATVYGLADKTVYVIVTKRVRTQLHDGSFVEFATI